MRPGGSMTSPSHRYYYAAIVADDAFHKQLVRVFGEAQAADMRYRPDAWPNDADLKAAAYDKKRADERLHEHWRSGA